ncbi:M48 family metallopeptidase [Mycoplasma simbae]|uniref:M48 family metallopeptidase n=1 Tax=Mycoplasma simbae TaxID=36744 RepID=UPI0004975FA5|nr:M48 family metallopeptidase [Mycoplasma simbae]
MQNKIVETIEVNGEKFSVFYTNLHGLSVNVIPEQKAIVVTGSDIYKACYNLDFITNKIMNNLANSQYNKFAYICADENANIHLYGKVYKQKFIYSRNVKTSYSIDTKNMVVTFNMDNRYQNEINKRFKEMIRVLSEGLELVIRNIQTRIQKDLQTPSFDIKLGNWIGFWGKFTHAVKAKDVNYPIKYSTLLLTLNKKQIESVVAHELTHYFYHNHSKDFYAKLTAYMPEYESLHEQLKKTLSLVVPSLKQ